MRLDLQDSLERGALRVATYLDAWQEQRGRQQFHRAVREQWRDRVGIPLALMPVGDGAQAPLSAALLGIRLGTCEGRAIRLADVGVSELGSASDVGNYADGHVASIVLGDGHVTSSRWSAYPLGLKLYGVRWQGRLGDPHLDIAPAVLFLATDDARYITGQSLGVDGGLFLHA